MRKSITKEIKLRKRKKLNPIIAEVKVYSPKYGDLLRSRDPLEIVKTYEMCNVAAISYITESRYFKGNFKLFKKICELSELPVLRKDFIKSKKEIERTAEAEASALLLIARKLGEKLYEFVDFSLEHGLETVVEVHSEDDVEVAVKTRTPIIGINNRDIERLEKDDGTVEVTRKLSNLIPSGFVKISESGISSLDDLAVALKFADAALIGTAFMRAENLEETVRSFVEAELC